MTVARWAFYPIVLGSFGIEASVTREQMWTIGYSFLGKYLDCRTSLSPRNLLSLSFNQGPSDSLDGYSLPALSWTPRNELLLDRAFRRPSTAILWIRIFA